MFKLTGTLKVANATQVISEKFSLRKFVITDESQYPQDIEFQLTQDKCDYLDQYKVGEKIDVSFNLRGREWNSPSGETKYFNTLEAWKIERVGGAVQQPIKQETTPEPHIADELDEMFKR